MVVMYRDEYGCHVEVRLWLSRGGMIVAVTWGYDYGCHGGGGYNYRWCHVGV